VNLLQRVSMRLTGSVYVGDRQMPGWRGPLPHYLFLCPVHGPVESYPHGYDQRLECPRCKEET